MTTDYLQTLARHVCDTAPEAIPEEARAAARTFILDSLGVAVAGSGDAWSRTLAREVPRWGSGGEARLWVHGTHLPVGSAALANAHFTHCLEFDCVHDAAVVHALAAVLSAALAQAERASRDGNAVSGADLQSAVLLGVDVAVTLGLSATGPMRFFRPATAGAFGATAAVARLAGLDADGLRNAWGNLYGQLSGTLQPHVEGTPLLALQMGFAARAALTAVDLTQAGWPGPRDVLQGPYGYFLLYEGGDVDPEPAFAGLGREWRIAEMSHKPFPSGRLTHGTIDGLRRLQAVHGFGAVDVERVEVHLPPLAYRLVGRPDVPAPEPAYARLCVPFVAAVALLRGTVDVPHFAPTALSDPEVHALAARVHMFEAPHPDARAIAPQHVTVRLHGGRSHDITFPHLLGHPANPLSDAEHLAKFRRNWGYGAQALDPDAGEALIDAVDRLEALPDAAALPDALIA